MYIAGWVVISLEIILLLIWVYSIFFRVNGTDPAGRGIAMGYLLGLIIYIAGSIGLLLFNRTWSIIVVFIMAALPLGIVFIGLYKEYINKKRI